MEPFGNWDLFWKTGLPEAWLMTRWERPETEKEGKTNAQTCHPGGAAMLLFAQGEATLCNLGDSRIFWLDSQQIQQISQDHVMPAPFGHKPPLLQYLGIPPREMRLCPYFTARPCCAGDGYLICSDGLTDMLSAEEIWRAAQGPADQAVHTLLEQALDRGGLDNITVILLKIGGQEKGMAELVKRFLRRKRNVTGN